MATITPEYVSTVTAASLLGLSRQRLGQLCRAGRFEGALRVGKLWKIPLVEVQAYQPRPDFNTTGPRDRYGRYMAG